MRGSDYNIVSGVEFSCFAPAKKWVIEGVVPEGITFLYGPSAAGKTFTAIAMGAAVATGEPFVGKFPVTSGMVVYVSLEGDIEPRWYAWCKRHGHLIGESEKEAIRASFHAADDYRAQVGPEAPDFYELSALESRDERDYVRALRAFPASQFVIVREPVLLLDDASVERFVEAIDEQRDLFEKKPPVRLIIFDTLSRAVAGLVDESTPQGMQKLMSTAEGLRRHFGTQTSIVFLHHPIKADGEQMRGSNVLLADPDGRLFLDIVGNVDPQAPVVPLMLTNRKAREGQASPPIALIKRAIRLVDPSDEAEHLTHTNKMRAKAGLAPLDKLDDRESCVVELAGDGESVSGPVKPRTRGHTSKNKETNAEKLLRVLVEHGGTIASDQAWRKAADVAGGSFHAAKTDLFASGRAVANDAGGARVIQQAA